MAHRVVVVDDAPDLRMLIGLAFRRDGRLEVIASVGDGQQGLDAVREHVPDVVLMDVSMPVMDGLTATAPAAPAMASWSTSSPSRSDPPK